jgi:hypothetical protein
MKQKNYAPVTPFERQTSHSPLYVAWVVLDEARDYFRTAISEDYATKFAHRAEMVFANHPSWQRRFQSAAGREHLLAVMRHWLAGVLAKEQPALFRDLPESYKVGTPLPPQPLSRPKKIRKKHLTPALSPKRRGRTHHFVHGCELLAV